MSRFTSWLQSEFIWAGVTVGLALLLVLLLTARLKPASAGQALDRGRGRPEKPLKPVIGHVPNRVGAYDMVELLTTRQVDKFLEGLGEKPPKFRIWNKWDNRSVSASKWNSGDRVVALQSALVDAWNLKEGVEYSVTVTASSIAKPAKFSAFVVRRTASFDFSGDDERHKLLGHPLAIGFNDTIIGIPDCEWLKDPSRNRSREEISSLTDADLVEVTIGPITGFGAFSQALRGSHANESINISTLFVLIAFPIGFVSSIGTDALDSMSDRGTDKDWLLRFGVFLVGLAASLLAVGVLRYGWFVKRSSKKAIGKADQ